MGDITAVIFGKYGLPSKLGLFLSYSCSGIFVERRNEWYT